MIGMEQVLKATADATVEFGDTVLAMEVQTEPENLPAGLAELKHSEVSIALVNDAVALQIGVCAPDVACTALSKALLGIPEDEEITEDDVTDGIGEVANIIAGGLKSRLDDDYPALKLGLPVWSIPQHGKHRKTTDVGSVPMSIGDNPVTLTVMRQERTS